ncbi:MAG: hypothetical protein EBR82_61410, partial [Caulobacteraceae bacterium]|nr:hypothetical protein [Caulobacteraceae bacterium]
GNVGIGTASPFTRTDSLSSRSTAFGSIASFNTMPLSVTDDTAFAIGVGGGINFRAKLTSSTYATYAAIWSARETATNSDYRGSLVFATADNANGYPSERARIDSSGNVGIGTASPYARASVRGAAGVGLGAWSTSGASPGTPIAASLFLGDDNFYNASFYNQCPGLSATYDAARGNSAALALYYYNGSNRAEGARLDGSGNVGIGTASPAAKFHVKDATNRNIIMTSGTTGMTTMTDGFFYIPAAAGAPTGVPTAIAGRVPMYYDTTNNNFYVYNGAWKKVLLA